MTLGKGVETVLVAVVLVVCDPEADAADKGQDGDGHVVPDQLGVLGKWHEGLTEGGGESVHEEGDGLDERSHVLGGLGEGVLETGDRGEDLRDTAENEDDGLGPDVDGGVQAVLVEAVTGVLATGVGLVDIVLHDAGCDHTASGDEETGGDTLQRGEVEAHLAETGVDDFIHDGDTDDERERVEVLDDVVWNAVQGHGSTHGGKVVQHLVVSKP